jgi:hypothetical protein
MEVDWVVGIFVFLVFIGWAFSYYFAIFQENASRFETTAEAGQRNVMGFISVDVYEAPVKYYSNGPVANGVLKAKSVWYSGEKNSTMVFAGGSPLPCRIDGDDLYWQADLSAGNNYFTITTANVNTTMNCTAAFAISSFNLTVPWALERKTMVSLTRINEMANTSYDGFRNSLGMNQNFRFRMERAGGDIAYGKSGPSGPVNVNSKKTEWKIYETQEKANITVAVW